MSGIAGLFGNINDTKKDHLTNVFNDALVERGPDGAGEYYGQNIFLFHSFYLYICYLSIEPL